MSDQAANPATGADAANPVAEAAPKVTNEASALDFFKNIHSRGSEPQRPTDDKAEDEPAEINRRPDRDEAESQTESEEEPSETLSDDETESADTDEATLELPDTIEGLAEKLETTPAELAAYLKTTVKTASGTQEVTLDELRSGYMRDADYRRKTTEVAEKSRLIAEKEQQLSTAVVSKLQDLDTNVRALESLIGEPPPLSMLQPGSHNYNPDQYHLLNGQYLSVKALLEESKNKLRGEAQRAAQERDKAVNTYRSEQFERLKSMVPEFRDSEKLRTFETEAAKRLTKDYGFTADDVKGFFQAYDARHIPMLRDAFAYRALQENRGQTVKKVLKNPTKAKPGASEATGKAAKAGGDYDKALRRVRSARPGTTAAKRAGLDLMKLKIPGLRKP